MMSATFIFLYDLDRVSKTLWSKNKCRLKNTRKTLLPEGHCLLKLDILTRKISMMPIQMELPRRKMYKLRSIVEGSSCLNELHD